jgi:hypothetical protein
MHKGRLLRNLLLGLCALVFSFALHAKMAVYNGTAPVKVTTATASKLWLDGQRMQTRSVESNPSVLLSMAVFCPGGLCLHREPIVQRAVVTSRFGTSTLHYRRRFLRPPPVQA